MTSDSIHLCHNHARRLQLRFHQKSYPDVSKRLFVWHGTCLVVCTGARKRVVIILEMKNEFGA